MRAESIYGRRKHVHKVMYSVIGAKPIPGTVHITPQVHATFPGEQVYEARDAASELRQQPGIADVWVERELV